MNYLLDTCAISEYKKLKPQESVTRWLNDQTDESVYLSALTIGELKKGIARMVPSKRKTDLEAFLEILLIRFDTRILPMTVSTSIKWGELTASLETRGCPMPVIDSFMAATALEHDLILVTRNEDDFAHTGVRVLNLWK